MLFFKVLLRQNNTLYKIKFEDVILDRLEVMHLPSNRLYKYVSNLGDSRAIIVNSLKNKILFISNYHKPESEK